MYYQPFSGNIRVYDPALPLSGTNPSITQVSQANSGLALMPNFSGGTVSPTFYTTQSGLLYYWGGANWINTGTPFPSVNLAGCGNILYGLNSNLNIIAYNGVSVSTLALVPDNPAPDIATDCNCNIYTISRTSGVVRKFSPAGTLLSTWTVTGIPPPVSIGGMAMVGNDIYYGSYKITIGANPVIAAVSMDPSMDLISDAASCAANMGPITGTLSNAVLPCNAPTVNLVVTTTVSAATFSWSGPGLVGATNASAVVVNAPGIYTCEINSPGCQVVPLTLTATVSHSSCISVSSTSITCASLGSATVQVTQGIGPFSYTWIPTNQTGSVATGLSPGTYTVVFYDAGSNTTTTATTVFTSLIPLTGNIQASSSITCHGAASGTANVTGIAGGSGSEHYFWTDGVSTYTIDNPQNLNAGQWSVTVTDAMTGCTVFSVVTITQPPALTVSIAASTPTVCLGSSIVLTGTATGGMPAYSYTWTGGPASDTYTVAEAVAGTYVYTLSSTDANTCEAANTVTVTFISNPTLTLNTVYTCPQAMATLTVSGANTYTWNTNATGATLSDSPATNAYYTVTGSALGCTSTAGAYILLYPKPVATITNNTLLCENGSLMLSAGGAASYTWSGPQGFVSALKDITLTLVQPAQSGVYSLTVTSVNGCTAGVSKTLTIQPTPTLSALGSTVCTSHTLHLSSISLPGAIFKWSGPQNFSSSVQNPSVPNPATNLSGLYTVSVTSAGGCTNTAVAHASVVPPPSFTISLSSNSLCAEAFNGSPNSITLTSQGAASYTLETPMVISNPGGPISSIKNLPPFQGISTATLYGSNGVCTVSTTSTFSVIANPTVSINTPTPVICAGESFTYTSFGANSYSWGPNSPGITTYSFGQVAVANPSVNSVFSVYGGSLGCNSAIKTTTITVNPLPKISVVPGVPAMCLKEYVVLKVEGSADSYSWWPYVGLSAMSGQTVSASPGSQQSYTVTASLNSCTNQAVVTVSVLPLPVVTATSVKPNVCLYELVTLKGDGGETYLWQNPENTLYAGQTVVFNASNPALSGMYTLTARDKNGCLNTAKTEIRIYSLPGGSLQGKNTGCVPFRSDFTYAPAKSAVLAKWQLEGKNFEKEFSYSFAKAGEYLVTGRFLDTLTGCANTKTFVVQAHEKPVAGFSILPEHPVEGLDEVRFTNTSEGQELTNWDWHFVNDKGYTSRDKHTSYLFQEQGLYPVAMVVQNKWGCADTMIQAIKIESDLAVYVPNIFTPNDDNRNEIFLPVVRGFKFYELSVFDRWGERLFFTTDPQSGWDGYFRGEPCKVDVYVWKITLSPVNGEMKTMTGQVMLNR